MKKKSASPPADPGSGRTRRILLVDDNPVNRRVGRAMLEKLGCEVDTAENGAEAIDRHAGGDYSMVLMDCRMPVLDGYEAASRLRDHERASGRHTPIIAMTANDEARDRDRCLAAGMDDFLAKPILTDDLRSTVERWSSAPRRVPSIPRSS